MKISQGLLKFSRDKLGYSQAKVAELIGVTQKMYSNYEAGTSQPRYGVVKKLVEVLEIDITKEDINNTTPPIADLAMKQVIFDNLAKIMVEVYKIPMEEVLKRLADETALATDRLLNTR